MASNLRVDNIQPSTGMGIGIGTANGSVTFNADVTGGLNIATGSVGIGTDAPWSKLSVYGDSISFGSGATTSDNRGILQYNSQNGDLDLKANSTGGNTFIRFYTSDAGSLAERLRINSTGNVQILNGNLVFSTSGTGIDFSAASGSAAGSTSALLDDYEEGTFTPTCALTYNPSSRTLTDNGAGTGTYIKIGKVVYCEFKSGYTAISGTGGFNVGIYGLPFVADGTVTAVGGVARSNINGYMFTLESILSTQVNVVRRYDNAGPVDGADNFDFSLTYITT